MNNAPDDDRDYIRTCPAGHRYHESEGGCGQCDEAQERAAMEPCPLCEAEIPVDKFELSKDGEYWIAICDCGTEIFR